MTIQAEHEHQGLTALETCGFRYAWAHSERNIEWSNTLLPVLLTAEISHT